MFYLLEGTIKFLTFKNINFARNINVFRHLQGILQPDI